MIKASEALEITQLKTIKKKSFNVKPILKRLEIEITAAANRGKRCITFTLDGPLEEVSVLKKKLDEAGFMVDMRQPAGYPSISSVRMEVKISW